jgi:DNA-binding PadR family transcriptional regulator
MSKSRLSEGEWAVLAVVAEGRTHGFAVARALARNGEVGAIWTVRRPLVYRAIDTLTAAGYIETVSEEPSPTGPPRRVIGATRSGKAAVGRWLAQPIEHLRDTRSLLLLKLLFLQRSGGDARPLLEAQRKEFEAVRASLRERRKTAEDFEPTIIAWRIESANAALRFIEAELERAR